MKQTKLKCYGEKLENLKTELLYKEVLLQFADTFKVLKTVKEHFGLPEIVETKIDEAVFFNSDKTKCLLIVLKRNNNNLVFGKARIIDGTLIDKKWLFEVSLEVVYSQDYFERYPENSFENISPLARYSVLTDGDVKKRGCEIDEYYWFKQLKK